MIKYEKARYAPYGFIEEAGVNKPLAHFGYCFIALHAPPAAAGERAVCLLIYKVAPAAYTLTDKKPGGRHIKHIEYVYLAYIAHNSARYKRAYNPAVNGKPRKTRGITESEKVLNAV